jgi:hypothetical protein
MRSYCHLRESGKSGIQVPPPALDPRVRAKHHASKMTGKDAQHPVRDSSRLHEAIESPAFSEICVCPSACAGVTWLMFVRRLSVAALASKRYPHRGLIGTIAWARGFPRSRWRAVGATGSSIRSMHHDRVETAMDLSLGPGSLSCGEWLRRAPSPPDAERSNGLCAWRTGQRRWWRKLDVIGWVMGWVPAIARLTVRLPAGAALALLSCLIATGCMQHDGRTDDNRSGGFYGGVSGGVTRP